MAIGSPSREARLEQLRTYARVQVRAGYASPDLVRAEVVEAAVDEFADLDHATAMADGLIDQAWVELARDQRTWPEVTAYDRFQTALDDLRDAQIVVLEAVDDHWAADAELRRLAAGGRRPRGIAYFTPADVWHAVEHGMLELNVWHGDSANVREGDALITTVQHVFARHGLTTRFDEGRLEVGLAWERRQVPPHSHVA